MKVLKDNYTDRNINIEIEETKIYPRKHICEHCLSELEYEKSDLRIGQYGCVFLDCPLCGRDNFLEEHEDEITLTVDNIEFPIHFRHTSKEKGAKDVCNNEYIKKCIINAIERFRKNKNDENDWAYFTGTGNTMVFVFKLTDDEEYDVYVTDDYYETYIPFEGCDY